MNGKKTVDRKIYVYIGVLVLLACIIFTSIQASFVTREVKKKERLISKKDIYLFIIKKNSKIKTSKKLLICVKNLNKRAIRVSRDTLIQVYKNGKWRYFSGSLKNKKWMAVKAMNSRNTIVNIRDKNFEKSKYRLVKSVYVNDKIEYLYYEFERK